MAESAWAEEAEFRGEVMKTNRKLKLRYIVIPLSAIVLIFVGFVSIIIFPDGFGMPMNYPIAFFGKSYFELYSFQTSDEKQIGEEIVERTKACMEYTGDETSAPETDALSRYYYFHHYDRPAYTEVQVDLNKAVIHGDEGNVWFTYTLEWYDENDNRICGSANILTRCTIKKDESGEWLVTNVSEPA